MTKDQLESAIAEAIQLSSISRLKTFCRIEDVRQTEVATETKVEQFSDLVLILLSGEKIHLTLKAFFNSKQCRPLLAETFGQEIEEGDLSRYATDAMKEVCNLVIGHMKYLLDAANMPCDISLPIAVRGYDEIFFKKKEAKKWQWQLNYNGATIVLEGLLILSDHKGVSFKYEEESGSLEFF